MVDSFTFLSINNVIEYKMEDQYNTNMWSKFNIHERSHATVYTHYYCVVSTYYNYISLEFRCALDFRFPVAHIEEILCLKWFTDSFISNS